MSFQHAYSIFFFLKGGVHPFEFNELHAEGEDNQPSPEQLFVKITMIINFQY